MLFLPRGCNHEQLIFELFFGANSSLKLQSAMGYHTLCKPSLMAPPTARCAQGYQKTNWNKQRGINEQKRQETPGGLHYQ